MESLSKKEMNILLTATYQNPDTGETHTLDSLSWDMEWIATRDFFARLEGILRCFTKWKYESDRPPHTPESHERYLEWYRSLSEDGKKVERAMHCFQVVPYERYDMKGCNDSTGREIHLEDLVVRDGKEGIVVHIITTEEIQICPVGDGLPEIVHPASVTVRSSFIEKLRGLASNEELLAILASVENRQALARDTGKERKASSGPKVAKAPKEDLEVDV